MRRLATLVASVAIVSPLALAQEPPQYPEGAATPRASTPAERAWMEANPLPEPDAVTPPPTGPVYCPSEYDPMEGILLAWEGPVGWTNLMREMARHITTTGNADVWVAVDSTSERTTARNVLTAGGVNMSRVNFVVRRTDSIWIRDYGPRYIYQGDCRAIVDHTYNQLTRTWDNAYSTYFSTVKGHTRYELPLRHGGGNYHLDSLSRSRATRLVVNENRSFTEQQIHDIWEDYQSVDTAFYQPFPRSVDATQHIDMWMQVIADNAVIISDWPFNPGSIQDNICESTALSMAAEGYTVYRVPARSVGGTHYTYTNVVMCNDIVLIPSYTQSSVQQHNSEALAVWQAALPSKTIIQLNCQAIVTAQGVMHCIVMHMPVHRGGLNPTAYLVNQNGGQILQPGTQAELRWITDDDEGVQNVDLLLSTDGGATFPTVIASAIPDTGGYVWTVPDLCTGQARIRVVARDELGRTGSDDSDGDFAVAGTGCSAASITYGTGLAGIAGIPALTSTSPVIGAPMTLDLTAAAPGSTSLLLLGAAPASVPFGSATLLVQFSAFVTLPVSGSGTASLNFPVPSLSSLTGVSLYWQSWVVDPAAAGGLATTAGLETRFGL